MNPTDYPRTLTKLLLRQDLSVAEAHAAFREIMDGHYSEAQIGALLAALATKGETVDEIAGAALAMREHVVPVETGGLEVIDIVGTGGTGLKTFNISTATTLVAAGAGLRVAKHGNRTNTRASGSADGLRALGVNIEAPPEVQTQCLKACGACFCYAVKHHPAMKYAVPVRKQLGVRTVFNLLGPLTNPAGAKRQITGVFDEGLVEPLARVFGQLGSAHVLVVHAEDGLDEISITSPTQIAEWRDGQCSTWTLDPTELGFPLGEMSALIVADPEESASRIRSILAGEQGPPADIVILNAGAAIWVGGLAPTLEAGVDAARHSLESGRAQQVLDQLIEISNR